VMAQPHRDPVPQPPVQPARSPQPAHRVTGPSGRSR
jgi:hypothetical protein